MRLKTRYRFRFIRALLVLCCCLGPGHAMEAPSPGPYGPKTPMIIWFHAVKTNPLGSLQTALSSGIPNHVMVSYMHRLDADWQRSGEALKAIEVVRQANVRLIWCRCLWPYYSNKQIKPSVLMDPDYYAQEIRALRAEGQAMKADLVALDLHPYARSPLKGLFKGPDALTGQQLARMRRAIQMAVEQAGQVDLVLPAGSNIKDHPYNILSGLGRIRICEGTYDWTTVKRIPYEYEVFGAHATSKKWRFVGSANRSFTIEQLLDQSQIWSQKHRLFIYTSGLESAKVADDLKAYTKALISKAYAGK